MSQGKRILAIGANVVMGMAFAVLCVALALPIAAYIIWQGMKESR
jgi:hypothetical protein